MVIKATATFDTMEQVEEFATKINELDVVPIIKGTTVGVDYIGYNLALNAKLIELFEDVRRHDVRTHD